MRSILKGNRVIILLIVLIGIALSLKSLREPDLWWQLRTGEWMMENSQVTKQDVFSFSYPEVEWVNVKWGYEILQAVASKIGGPEFLPIIQGFLTIGIVLLLLTLIRGLSRDDKKDKHPSVWALMVIPLALLVAEFRMTGRPESISHIMMLAYVVILQGVFSKRFDKKWLIAIPILQVLWSNLHEAYGMGIAIVGIFSVGYGVQEWLRNKQIGESKWFFLTTIIAIAAISINPRGIYLISHTLNIFGQLSENKFTTELYNFRDPLYWQWRTYLNVLFIAIAAWVAWSSFKGKGKDYFLKHIGLPYVLLVGAMFYLSFSAQRNIPFSLFITVPIIAWWVNTKFTKQSNKSTFVAYGLLALLYLSIVSNKFYEWTESRDTYGLYVRMEKTPIGATEFINSHGIKGNAFCDFLSSSYLLWRLQPDFKTYIDLRDLDIYPGIFYENNLKLYQNPSAIFPIADADMQFTHVHLLNDPTFVQVHRYLLGSPDFELVYADQLSSLYVRNLPEHTSLIAEYGWQGGQRDVFNVLSAKESSAMAKAVSFVFNPLFSEPDVCEMDADLYRQGYYQSLGVFPNNYRVLECN